MALHPAKYENRAAQERIAWGLTPPRSALFSSPLSHTMANTRSAAKSARQTVRRTLQNKRVLTGLKSHVKKVRAAFAAKDKPAAAAEVKALASMADKAAKTGRIHRNKANRQKSRLNKQLAALG